MTVASIQEAVQEAADLYQAEVDIRERARHLETDPDHRPEVERLYSRATDIQHRRLSLLRRWHLL